ncbi:putative T-complex protein 1 subunit theta [Schizosaccharomyces pombe]|uniref:Probable T-complex protein 1 subunit theta n=1 Tax=Schizosaccharomyces pombe (strain 972 / ATCC 24843) TaxID=284812 RepID=TCPQ_SCHPO|nr:chaperonin-containing T-complex theta subunit Cct8 [Schizosaccharomyces pombe]P78921.3 RecName: Full=Probable T-complex protein 1 subunit theta; Short=TCP-1-theta; AltName: Full=CCT-theta [Schizosaccharomyces pombe 972h-]CAA21275.1 chaperonin-containing T-complex theta subunit Cct8 [Schizosaccharomyces pombe]|eukprot:NP_595406.1 chaperonin-containing T-complex theta subunit Cct8 [Schizosaccharomyces pombe]
MALRVPKASGPQLFREGYRIMQGVEDAVIRNCNAIRELSEITRTSLGPNGKNKIVVNHLQQTFLTNDAATIIRELEVIHPAAKLVVDATQQQENELGDAANFVVVFTGELLAKAENMIRMGLTPLEIAKGYEMALSHTMEVLEEICADKIETVESEKELIKAIRTCISSKQYGNEDFLSDLVAKAILTVLPKDPSKFNVDNIRVVKIMGSSLYNSQVVKGMVFPREPEGTVTRSKEAKVAVFSCPLDISQTETKGTVLLHNAQEMLDFSKGEENLIESHIKEIYDAGVRVVVTSGNVNDLVLHYLNRFEILVIRVPSKFELRRLCRVVGATPLARMGVPMPEEMGSVDVVETIEIGGDRVTVFRQVEDITRTATIVLRGATKTYLDDLERAIDDGVNIVKALVKDNRLIFGAGASDMQLCIRLISVGEKTPGIYQHAIKQYGEAFEVVPRTISENAGLDPTDVISKLYAAHHKENGESIGVDVECENDGTLDAKEAGIFDVLLAKKSAIRLATETVLTVLNVDQVVMSKPAGGPKPPGPNPHWDDD